MKVRLGIIALLSLLVLLSACSASETNTGTLQGTVTIFPLTAVQKAGETPSVAAAEQFTRRGIEILKGGQDEVYKTVYFNADGTYSVQLPEGNYIVRTIANDLYLAKELPTSVKITRDQITVLDITIDTGIR